MYICILNYIDSKHQPWRVSVTDMGWLIHRSIFQGWKVWVQPIGTMNPSVVLIGTSRKLLLGFNRDYQNHEDIGPHVCWDSPTLRIEFQLWTLDFKKKWYVMMYPMIFPIRFQQQAPRNSWSIPSIPGPLGSPNPQVKPEERVETSWESALPVHGSTAWKPNCRDSMDRYGSLAPATPECWIRQTFPDGESKGNHPQTTIRNVKHIRYIYIYI